MDTRFFVILAFTTFGTIMVGAILGNVLESMGIITKESLGPRGTALMLAAYFVLFCILAFSLVPLFVTAFVALQVKIGNGELVIIRWVREHLRFVVYGFWTIFAVGLILAFTLARDDILKQFK